MHIPAYIGRYLRQHIQYRFFSSETLMHAYTGNSDAIHTPKKCTHIRKKMYLHLYNDLTKKGFTFTHIQAHDKCMTTTHTKKNAHTYTKK
jgi:hypothetical protein